MTPVQVVGIGLEGAAGLPPRVRQIVEQADVLVGGDRHLSYFPDHPAVRWRLGSFAAVESQLRSRLAQPDPGLIVVLASGDPLFFGIGRWLLQVCDADQLTFHPHPSAIQLAFSRLKCPWQAATLISAHGRSTETLIQALKRGDASIAMLTDNTHSPAAIARLIEDLDLPITYQFWLCENLGGADERVQGLSLAAAREIMAAPLNVVVLQRQPQAPPPPQDLPRVGIPDSAFLSFRDRPSLMTKRPVRLLVLGELALGSCPVFWDIGAGTGSVSVEVARLCPEGQVWAIEPTAMGAQLIHQNAARFGTPHIKIIQDKAPTALAELPNPDRIFVGGSGGQLSAILAVCAQRLQPGGRLVAAIATLDNLTAAYEWCQQQPGWQVQFQQLHCSRSTAVGPLMRWHPLNPVTLMSLTKPSAECPSTAQP